MRRLGTAVGVISLGLVLSAGVGACTPARPASPSTSYSCTPDAKRQAGPCTKADHEEQAAEQALFEEAERVYREFTNERFRIAQEGGTSTPSPVMERLATEKTLAEAVSLLNKTRELGRRMSGTMEVRSLRRNPALRDGALISLSACEDGSAVKVLDASNKQVSRGQRVNVQAWFKRVDGALKIFDWDGKANERCID